MNLPNQLTLSRLVMTVAFLGAIMSRYRFGDTLALALFVAASLTDLYDGRIARQRKLITNFGILMDPLADKILTCSAFIALVERGLLTPQPAVFELGAFAFRPRVEAWMAVVIVARELIITGLRMLAASKNVVLAADRSGKQKTILQMTAIISLLTLEASAEWPAWLSGLLTLWAPIFTMAVMWLAVLLTAGSGFLYLWRNRALYLSDM
jgi:CDP-diacylglycerol--glycerol-3-phosphate 3-phosphatidyltransferase